jgi:hypothetical protein
MAPKRNDAVVIPLHGPTLATTEGAAAVRESAYHAEILDETDYENGATLLHEISEQIKSVKADMDAIIRPINDGVKRIRAMYRPTIDSLEAAKDSIKNVMLLYRQRLEAQREIADREARKALAQGDHATAMTHVAEAVKEIPRIAGVSVRLTWKLRVIDPYQVPREFLMVDTVALRKHAVQRGWTNPPPGVAYFQEEGIASI